ncbi:MAG TPA: hypothetical protein VK756_00535 [Solirubrobacteraceae bacterium]|jgi:hypothetical protein|nr:hypothetical protein [Solirubrobacteraceae bacterium]
MASSAIHPSRDGAPAARDGASGTLRGVRPVFPGVPLRAGMYESFYLRAVAPDEPRGLWIRYTVHKRPGARPRGSLWCTFFDGTRERPFTQKLTTDALAAPPGGWIAVGDGELGPEHATGACGGAQWSLRIAAPEPELRHLPRAWMYRAPLPRTKLTSPAPAARFDGALQLPGPDARAIELRGWRGMVGHNWGAEHAERWIWLHGIGFEEDPEAWLDVAIGRIRIAGRMSPWLANGVLSLAGERHRLGGLGTRGLLVAATARHSRLSLPGAAGLTIEAHVDAPAAAIAGWRYADPDGGEHDVANCSIAALALTVNRPNAPSQTLRTTHGAAYELGMRERDHGVAIAPFADG